MRTPKLKLAVIAIAAAFAGNASAIDFLQTYRLARQNDAAFSSARAGLEAGLEKLPQGRALLLPVINGTANTNWNDGENRTTGVSRQFNSNGYNITLTQPLFRWQNIVQYKQSEFQVLQSEAQFGQATQDLIVRVAQAYFDVLAAQDNIEFIVANKIAIAEQLAQAKRNFEVGTATITDTNEAQARFDLAVAQEISGQNALEVAVRALQQIIGQLPDKLTPLKAVAMTVPVPNVMDEWANAARGNNFVVRGNEAVFEIATREIERQRAGHYPTLDVVASTQDNTNENLAAAAALAGGARANIQQNIVGLQLALPIFAGGSVLSRTREAVALREKARQDLEASRRAAEFNARQSYLNVTNGLAQVKALEQALVSSETALQSNRVGYEVGVRINIDVLNAQQQVFQTKRDLARARYDTILNGLRLKSAAGSLTENDVELVNALLGFEPGATPAPVPTQPMKPPTGMLDSPGPAPVAASARAGDPGTQKNAASASATRTTRASEQTQKEKAAASGKAVSGRATASGKAGAPAKAVASEKAAAPEKTAALATTVPTPAEPTTAAARPPAPVAEPATPLAAPAAASQTPVATPAAASPAAVEKPLEASTNIEKSVAAPEPVAAAAPVEESPPAEAPIVPIAMQPSPALEKALPAPEAAASIPASKPAVQKDSAKSAPKSVSSKTKNSAREAAAATQALVAEATSVAVVAPAAQAADAPPARVYSVVEPRIPGSRTPVDQAPASGPKQD
jgi:outer membrane protein